MQSPVRRGRSRRARRSFLAIAAAAVVAAATAAALYAADISTLEINPATAQLEEHETDVPDSPSSSNAPKVAPGHDGNKLAKSNPGFTGWAGLNFVDQRTADGGNQFSLEPPDQALCVGNGRVLEAVNTVMAMYSTSGQTLTGNQALTPFFFPGSTRSIERKARSGRS